MLPAMVDIKKLEDGADGQNFINILLHWRFFYKKIRILIKTNLVCLGFSACLLCCSIEEYGDTYDLDKFSNVFRQKGVEFCIRSWNLMSCSHTFLKVRSLLLNAHWNMIEY